MNIALLLHQSFRFFFVSVLLLLSLVCKAEKVSKDESLLVAQHFYQNQCSAQTGLKSAKALSFSLAYTSTNPRLKSTAMVLDSIVYYYVYNVGNDNGFVIVAGDNLAKPVLAYSTEGSFDSNNLPLNFKSWMDGIQFQISELVNSSNLPSPESLSLWNQYLSGNISSLRAASVSVAPLLSTKWNQGTPYNNLCPLYNATNRSATGCVATSMAQLIKYYNYPTKGNGSSSAYLTSTNGIYIPEQNYATYDWANMSNTYSASSTLEQKSAVATLMYDCGRSLSADYASTTSASIYDMPLALLTAFSYDSSIVRCQRKYYDDAAWEQMLKDELTENRPIIYRGENVESGHAFVCDGYDNTGLFHYNWGWGGNMDGYFASNALNPGAAGVGSGSGTYNIDQAVLINIKPNVGGHPFVALKLYSGIVINASQDTVAKGSSFTFNAGFLNAQLIGMYNGQIGVELLDDQNKSIAIIGSKAAAGIDPGLYRNSTINCLIPYSLPAGSYRLRPVSRFTDLDSWAPVTGVIGGLNELPLYVKNEYETPLVLRYNMTSTASVVKNMQTFTVVEMIKNTGATPFTGYFGTGLFNDKDSLLAVLGENPTTSPLAYGYVRTCTISCSVPANIPLGNYKIKPIAKPTGYDWSVVKPIADTVLATLGLTVTVTSNMASNNSDEFLLYPNPMENELHVDGIKGNANLLLFNMSGVELFSLSIKDKASISVANLPKGVYLVKIISDSGVLEKKVFKK